MNKSLRVFQLIDKHFRPSAAWWSEELGISERHAVRYRRGLNNPRGVIASSIMNLDAKILEGEITPPSREQRREDNYEKRKGGSGYWGVFHFNHIVGRWVAYFQHGGCQHHISACKTKAEAIGRAYLLAGELGCNGVNIRACQLRPLKKPWRAAITKRVNGKSIRQKHIGYYATAEEAARAYDREAQKQGKTKRLNFA